MKITRVATSIHRPVSAGEEGRSAVYAGTDGPVFVRCRVETDEGLTGNGFTGRFLAAEVAHFLNGALGTAALGMDPLDPDLVNGLEAKFNPRAMTGVVVSAFSAFEIALTDIRARVAGKSIAGLLGGKRDSVPVHVTCGLPHLDMDALQATCRDAVAEGAAGVKVIIADRSRCWEEDAERIVAVREAIGDDADLIADANCKLPYEKAVRFAKRAHAAHLAWLEEPLPANDPPALARLSEETGVPLGAGQMEQSPYRFRQLIDQGRIAVIQPNAVFAGGFSRALEVMRMAEDHDRLICPAGGWDFVNLHLMAGATARGAMEYHAGHAAIVRCITGRTQQPENGCLAVPNAAGLGIGIDENALETARL
ncbi:mandelate racemase/muconate lactonizing enzyme family protein [Nisaea sp.]|uniref:mandelate racemase/muconate lactonizing enzyme family protein n=1 Tax=Nisaea sp. TaxID=2024842 RepID=UPI003B51BF7E